MKMKPRIVHASHGRVIEILVHDDVVLRVLVTDNEDVLIEHVATEAGHGYMWNAMAAQSISDALPDKRK